MKLKKKTVIIAGIVILVISSVVAGLVTDGRKTPHKTLLKILPANVDLQVKNVHYTEIGDSDAKWEIKADTARYLKKENLVLFDNVTVTLDTRDGKTFVMTGDRGQLNTNTKDIGIAGNIKIISHSGNRFTTDRLTYSHGDKRFHTNSAVVMETPRMQVKGVGMSISLKNEELTLFSRVSARIR
ncbi:MAG: LPS export ABC transporter periplasmic protein LptC [Syntrophales bacterium]|nr:LPS export ABC transporter periplasmic protein LptC [Syntrophales bacterium]